MRLARASAWRAGVEFWGPKMSGVPLLAACSPETHVFDGALLLHKNKG